MPAVHRTPVERELRRAPLYSEELGIALERGTERECFKWLLASILFGARIGETIAKNTYRAFERHDLLTPRAIVAAGWDYLVNPIMREGGYVRYDGRKSTQILRVCQRLLDEYGGRITEVHRRASDARDLERCLQQLYGVGPVTTNIFLRELRPFWSKADPEVLPRVRAAARARHVALPSRARKSLAFTRLEAGLVRMRRGDWHASRTANRPHAHETPTSPARAARTAEQRRRRAIRGSAEAKPKASSVRARRARAAARNA